MHGRLLDLSGDLDVDALGHGDGRVPEHVLNGAELDALGVEQGRAGVPQIVEPNLPNARLGAQAGEPAVEIPQFDRCAKSKWKFGNLVAFGADREASGREWKPTDQTQTVRQVPADDQIAEAYGIEPGSPVYERARLIKDGDQPTHTLTSYYLPKHVEGTPIVDPTPGPAGRGGGFAVLTMQGLEPDHMTETFFARMPTPEELSRLELPAGEPVMILERRTYTAADELVEVARGVHAASRFAWTYSFTIPD